MIASVVPSLVLNRAFLSLPGQTVGKNDAVQDGWTASAGPLPQLLQQVSPSEAVTVFFFLLPFILIILYGPYKAGCLT